MDCFRIAVQNCGNENVKFATGGTLKRRKSRTFATLDMPSGMQRNLSESHLMQAGSKAVSNVADKFSKLGQTFNPKILTGKKATNQNKEITSTAADKQNFQQEVVPNDTTTAEVDANAIESVDQVAVDVTGTIYNDNSFLQSVGIVMVDAGELADTTHGTETRKPNKKLENFSRMSITSVTDNINMPLEMLDINNLPGKSAPEINVQETDDAKTDKGKTENNLKNCHSVADMRSAADIEEDYGSRYIDRSFFCCCCYLLFEIDDELCNKFFLCFLIAAYQRTVI